MAPFNRFLALLSVLALALTGCSVTVDMGAPSASSTPTELSVQQQVATGVAQAVQALTQEAPTGTPTPMATATPTPLPLPATLSVSAATNCYAGPNTNYGFVITIRPGTVVTVTGKDTPDNYWIIEVPGYPGTVCWLSGQYASVSGDTASLPSPATPLPSIYTLSEPRGLRVSCTAHYSSDSHGARHHGDHENDPSSWTVVFRWKNTSPDATGVRVYRNGRLVARLGPGGSSYTDTFSGRRFRGVTYGVQAYNATAVSSIVTVGTGRCD
ncbi:MAG: hypothetical protein ACK2T0_11335 [Anaerolineales bacterium]